VTEPTSSIDLFNRLSIAVDRNKGIRLSPEDVDLLVIMGGYGAVSQYIADWVRQRSETRIADRAAEHADAMDKAYQAQFPKPHLDPYIEAARRRAWELTQHGSGPRTK